MRFKSEVIPNEISARCEHLFDLVKLSFVYLFRIECHFATWAGRDKVSRAICPMISLIDILRWGFDKGFRYLWL